MPVQTQKKSHIYFPDGALVEVKEAGGTYYDVGAINSSVTATLNWDESTVETANAGKLATRISNMEIAGGFTLINLNPEGVKKLGNGVFKINTTDDTAISSGLIDQKLGNVTVGAMIELRPSTANGALRIGSVAPTLAVKKAYSTTAVELVEDTDYEIVSIGDEHSRTYFVKFLTANNDCAVVYSSVTPVKSSVITAGSSSKVLEAYAMRITHTDGNGRIRRLELFSVYGGSGSFQFNFKGANEDGVEEMPLTFTARLDTALNDNEQLFAWTIDENAE